MINTFINTFLSIFGVIISIIFIAALFISFTTWSIEPIIIFWDWISTIEWNTDTRIIILVVAIFSAIIAIFDE